MNAMIQNSLKPEHIVVLYTVQHLSCSQIAPVAGISRQRVWKILRDQGINTGRGEGGATRIKYDCDFCGKEGQKTRAVWRKSAKHYCTKECYFAAIKNPGYHQWRHGLRIARQIVSQCFKFQENNIIHHKDGDNRNNEKSNLAVYKSQSEHMNYHRGGKAQPVWDGRNIYN